MITVLTAAYGEDVLQNQPEQSVECRWLAVTDHTRHPEDALTTWDRANVGGLRFEPRPHLSPRMAAKIPKYLPALYVPEDHAVTVWMDCSVRLTSPYAIERFTSMARQFHGGMHMIPHPDRRTVRDEAPQAAAQGRYAGQMIREQAEWYADHAWYWTDDRLWATTIIVQQVCPDNHVMGLKWLAQNCIWSAQDQVSLPWTAANSFVKIWPITLDLWNNEYFTLREREVDV